MSEASIYNLNLVRAEDLVRGYKSLIAGTAVGGTRTGLMEQNLFPSWITTTGTTYHNYATESLFDLEFAF